jgi:predicted  nucleic acid-binding Zn-ribbon protein
VRPETPAVEASLFAQAEKDWSFRIERMAEAERLLKVELESTRARAQEWSHANVKLRNQSNDAEARVAALVLEKEAFLRMLESGTTVSGTVSVAVRTSSADTVAEIERNEHLIREKAELVEQHKKERAEFVKERRDTQEALDRFARKVREDERLIAELRRRNDRLELAVPSYLSWQYKY